MSFLKRTPDNIRAAEAFLKELRKGLDRGKGRYKGMRLDDAHQLALFATLHQLYMKTAIMPCREDELIKLFRSVTICGEYIPKKIFNLYWNEIFE